MVICTNMNGKKWIRTMNGKEVWKPVVGYEGLYEVSNTGKVRSLYDARWDKYRVKELKPLNNSRGYLMVFLYKDGERKMHTVHKLVMAAFVGPRPEGYDINHIDEDKTNNRVDNLEYCTHRENNNWGTRTERVTAANTNGKLSRPVLEFDQFADLAWAKCWPSANEAGRAGYNIGNVSLCCNGKRSKHHGKIFRYIPVAKDVNWSNWSIRDL